MNSPTIPKPGDFQEPLKQVLALLAQEKATGTIWLTASEISSSLLTNYGISLHWKTIDTMLKTKLGFAARRKKNKKWEFAILNPGMQEVSKAESPILFVNPTKAVQSVLSLHDFFATLKGSVRICDPYLDAITVQHLEAFTAATAIKLLTYNISDTPTLRLAAQALASVQQFEIRRPASDLLHDRYVIAGNSMIIMGTSLNSFGKKQSFVVKAGMDIRAAVLNNFNDLWNAASTWP
jgi:hypothetical protein